MIQQLAGTVSRSFEFFKRIGISISLLKIFREVVMVVVSVDVQATYFSDQRYDLLLHRGNHVLHKLKHFTSLTEAVYQHMSSWLHITQLQLVFDLMFQPMHSF